MPDRLTLEIGVVGDALTWMTVLGCVQLALRHPEYTGPSSEVARNFATAIAKKLRDEGVFSAEEVALMMRDQMMEENCRRKV